MKRYKRTVVIEVLIDIAISADTSERAENIAIKLAEDWLNDALPDHSRFAVGSGEIYIRNEIQ